MAVFGIVAAKAGVMGCASARLPAVSGTFEGAGVGARARLQGWNAAKMERFIRSYRVAGERSVITVLARDTRGGPELVILLSTHFLYFIRHQLLRRIPLPNLRDVTTDYDTLCFTVGQNDEVMRFRVTEGLSCASVFETAVAAQLYSLQDTEVSVPLSTGEMKVVFRPWRPGCPADLRVAVTGLWAPGEDKLTAARQVCVGQALASRRADLLPREWNLDDGTGEHLRHRVIRAGDGDPDYVLSCSQITSEEGSADNIWLAYSAVDGFAWVPRRWQLRTTPFSQVPWSDIDVQKTTTRMVHLRGTDGPDLVELHLAVRWGAPVFCGWSPPEPDQVPTIAFVLDSPSGDVSQAIVAEIGRRRELNTGV